MKNLMRIYTLLMILGKESEWLELVDSLNFGANKAMGNYITNIESRVTNI